MKRDRLSPSEGNTPSQIDYGKALMNQKGGWTLAELKPRRKRLGDNETEFTRNGFTDALRKASRQVSEPESKDSET